MTYISDDLDKKILELRGEFNYSDIYKQLKNSTLIGLPEEEALNFLRQSIYRLKRDRKISVIHRGLFAIGIPYNEEYKEKLSSLLEKGEASRDTDELALEYKLTNQIPFTKSLIISKSNYSKVINDLGVRIKYTSRQIDKENIKHFEFGRLSLFFDFKDNKQLNTFSRLLISNNLYSEKEVLKIASLVHPMNAKQLIKLAELMRSFNE